MKLIPSDGKVVIQRDEAVSKTDGGILLPDTAKEKPKKGKVVAAALGKWQYGKFVESRIKSGDAVLFNAYAGSEVEIDGQILLIMDDTEVLAVILK